MMERRVFSMSSSPSLSRDNADARSGAFYAAFERLAGQSLPSDSELDQAIMVRSMPAGQLLFAAGSVDRRLHVVLDGFITLKYESPDGTSWVKGFVPPHIPFACLSCLDGGPAPYSAVAGSSATVASVQYSVLERMSKQSMPWLLAMCNAIKFYGQRKEKREMELLLLSAEERYLRFLHEMPEIAQRLKQHEIASYVRVTPVSLSRIRQRLRLASGARAASSGTAATAG